jgi:uncharacterized protein YyaL (SSP411 family)
VGAVAALVSILVVPAARGDADAVRAVATYGSMQRFFYRPVGLYVANPSARASPYATAWPFSQAFAATIMMAELPGIGTRYRRHVVARLRGLDRYWNGRSAPGGYDSSVRPPLGYGGVQYYDDNEWIGRDLLAAHRVLGGRALVRRARRLFLLVERGWDRNRSHPCPGGVFWSRSGRIADRNTVSTANGAALALALYRETHSRHYLRWAGWMYGWVYRCMAAPNELFWDHIDLSGNLDTTHWSYNQGLMILTGTMLYEATGNERFLVAAERVADAAVDAFAGEEATEPPEFMALFLRSLLVLDTAAPARQDAAVAQAYADTVWSRYRDPATGLFRFDPRKPPRLLEQAAMVQLYAALAAKAAAETP